MKTVLFSVIGAYIALLLAAILTAFYLLRHRCRRFTLTRVIRQFFRGTGRADGALEWHVIIELRCLDCGKTHEEDRVGLVPDPNDIDNQWFTKNRPNPLDLSRFL